MKNLSKFSVRRPVTIVMAMLIVMMLGAVSLINTTTDLFPTVNTPYLMISTPYLGASPEEVESGVTAVIEKSVATTSNVMNITSQSSEHFSMLFIEFVADTNMDSALIEITQKLDIAEGELPDGVGNSIIQKLGPDLMPIMQFSISKEGLNSIETKMFIESIKPRLESIEGVGQVSFVGLDDTEIKIILDESKIDNINQELNDISREQAINDLVKSGVPKSIAESKIPKDLGIELPLTKEMIENILKGQNFKMPLGYVSEGNVEYLLRIGDDIKSLEEVRDLEVLVINDFVVKLSDIANVNMYPTSTESYSKVNGKTAVLVDISKQGEFAITEVSDNVNKRIEEILASDTGIEINMLMDQAKYIDLSVGSVSNNLLFGALLAVIVLIVFLRDLRPTFIIGLAIPISLMTAFIMIYFAGITLNMISMGGLALGIGMLVDNSIVVIENIYRLRSNGESVKDAAIKGASQVASAIFASTLTTITVFVPVIFMEGFVADIFVQMALVITFSLFASLIISLSLVPMLSSKMLKRVKQKDNANSKLAKIYYKIVSNALRFKLLYLIPVLLLFAGSLYLTMQKGMIFFPETERPEIMATLIVEEGIEFDDLTEKLDIVMEEVKSVEGVESVSAAITNDVRSKMMGGGDKTVFIKTKDNNTRPIDDIEKEILAKLKIRNVIIEFSGQQGMQMLIGDNSVDLIVKGYDFETLENIIAEIEEKVSSVNGISKIDNNAKKYAPEYKITIDREKAIEKGFTSVQVFMSIGEFMRENEKATSINYNGQLIDVFVYDADESITDKRLSVNDLYDYMLTSPTGNTVALTDIALVEKQNGYSTINRINQNRTISVTITPKDGYELDALATNIYEKVDTIKVPNGYSIEKDGQVENTNNSIRDLQLAMAFSIILIYMVMASQFQSFILPFIVMFTIPLAFTGGLFLLYFLDMPMSVIAMVGFIILSGVVVNNGIVLVDYINQLRRNGVEKRDAIIIAGITRFRPIIMTATTTILALITMAVGVGEGTEIMQPLAITSIGGLIYATFLTLIIIPIVYDLFTSNKPLDNY